MRNTLTSAMENIEKSLNILDRVQGENEEVDEIIDQLEDLLVELEYHRNSI